jgi:hypothetical protein
MIFFSTSYISFCCYGKDHPCFFVQQAMSLWDKTLYRVPDDLTNGSAPRVTELHLQSEDQYIRISEGENSV